MINKINKRLYGFTIKGRDHEIFFANDGYVEVYETNNPGKTGYIFPDLKQLTLFVNNLTDAVEMKMNEESNEG